MIFSPSLSLCHLGALLSLSWLKIKCAACAGRIKSSSWTPLNIQRCTARYEITYHMEQDRSVAQWSTHLHLHFSLHNYPSARRSICCHPVSSWSTFTSHCHQTALITAHPPAARYAPSQLATDTHVFWQSSTTSPLQPSLPSFTCQTGSDD